MLADENNSTSSNIIGMILVILISGFERDVGMALQGSAIDGRPYVDVSDSDVGNHNAKSNDPRFINS